MKFLVETETHIVQVHARLSIYSGHRWKHKQGTFFIHIFLQDEKPRVSCFRCNISTAMKQVM